MNNPGSEMGYKIIDLRPRVEEYEGQSHCIYKQSRATSATVLDS